MIAIGLASPARCRSIASYYSTYIVPMTAPKRQYPGSGSRSVAGLPVLLCIGCDVQLACASRLSRRRITAKPRRRQLDLDRHYLIGYRAA